MPSFQWSQVNQTNPSPYDQIFILSEAVINDSFRNMFPQPVAFSRQDKEALQTRRTGQWISSGQVGPPSVRMHVEERSPAFMMWFTLEFTGGKIHLRTTAPWESPARYNNFDLTGWKLVFKTRIASKVLNSSDPKLNAYRSINGFRDSVFELAQLYLDTSDVGAGAGFDASRSSFSGTSLDSKTLDNLKLFVNEWLTTADERGLNVIGYRLRRKTDEMDAHVRKLVGTFAPSIIDYAPYAWIDPSRPTVETDGLRQNALAMLTYTESSRRSNYERPGLAHSGAFTDGGAAFCMNRDLFWNHFLLNLLKEINQKTEVVPQKSRNLNFEIRYLLGKNPKHRDANDRYFGWKQQTKDGQPHWVWKGDAQKHADKWGNRREKWYKYAQEARSSTELSFRAGGGNIDVKGQVVYDAHVTQFGHPWNMTFHSITEWKLKFRIEAVRGGGIQIVRVGQPTTKAKTVKTTNHGFHDRLGRVSTQGLRNLEKGLANLLNKGLQRITNQLARDLQNLHKLFLPGGGVFRFGTPQFNKRGDILAPMHYLNISAPTGNFVVKRAVRDPSDKTQDTDPSVQEDDLEVQFERIALMPESEEYLEDVPVFDDDNMHHHIELEYEEEEEPYIFLDLSDLNGDELANSDDFWPGPGPGPLAGVDWDRIDRTERPWHEEGDDEDPTDEYPTDEYPTKQPDKKSPKVSPRDETPKTEVPVEIPIDEADLPPDLGGPLDG